MKTILALLVLLVASVANAATFNAVTGVGSCTDAEIGWGPDNATAFICVEQENYAVSVQYVNAQGATVTGVFPGIRRSHSGIFAKQTMGGYNFLRRNPAEWIPTCTLTVGKQFVVNLPGESTPRVGVVTGVSLQSTTVNVQAFNPLKATGFGGFTGYKTVY